jgi:hypothetical protein
MSQQETTAPALSPRKKVRREIGEKVAGALEDYRQELGEKVLATHIRHFSKLISRDLLKVSKKRKKTAKKERTGQSPKSTRKAAKQQG